MEYCIECKKEVEVEQVKDTYGRYVANTFICLSCGKVINKKNKG